MLKGYTLVGLSPLHACVFSLFLTLCNKFYADQLNSLYMSATFLHLSYTHHNRVKVQCVCQTDGQGIPRELLQTELHNKK